MSDQTSKQRLHSVLSRLDEDPYGDAGTARIFIGSLALSVILYVFAMAFVQGASNAHLWNEYHGGISIEAKTRLDFLIHAIPTYKFGYWLNVAP